MGRRGVSTGCDARSGSLQRMVYALRVLSLVAENVPSALCCIPGVGEKTERVLEWVFARQLQNRRTQLLNLQGKDKRARVEADAPELLHLLEKLILKPSALLGPKASWRTLKLVAVSRTWSVEEVDREGRCRAKRNDVRPTRLEFIIVRSRNPRSIA
jgi:hypothetical protein